MNTPHVPVTRAMLTEVYNSMTPTAIEIVNENEQVPLLPVLAMFDSRPSSTMPFYIGMVAPTIVAMLHTSRHAREAIPKMIDQLLATRACTIVVHICEAWRADGMDENVPDLIRAGVPVGDMPGAHPCVMVTLHTVDGANGQTMRIHVAPDGRRSATMLPLRFDTEVMSSVTPQMLETAQRELKS